LVVGALRPMRLSRKCPLKIERWSKVWDGATFRDGMKKVLVPMKPPEPGCTVKPTRFFGLAVFGHGSVWYVAEVCLPRKIEG